MVSKNVSVCLLPNLTPIISGLAEQSSKHLIYDFLAGKNCPDSPHSHGGMKFATQISPLLNIICAEATNFCTSVLIIHNKHVINLLRLFLNEYSHF